jgi:ribonuclease R
MKGKPPRKSKSDPLRSRDPWLEREREKYTDPLPSREFLLQLLEEHGAPMRDQELMEWLDIAPHEMESFRRRLGAMQRDGQIMINRRGAICVADKLELIKGRVEGHKDGFGFLIPDDGSDDLFLSPKEMRLAMHGDRVMAKEIGTDRRGRREAKIVEVLERAVTRLVGRFYTEKGIHIVVPENRRISQDILIPPPDTATAKPGQVVMADIVSPPSKHAPPIGRVVEVLGDYGDPGMEIEIALRSHELPHVFPGDAEKQADQTAKKVHKSDWEGREDLTGLPLVTIDGETAKDFDDAVFCEARGRGYRLIVAIADVSHYVRHGDALDREAMRRGNSIYFPRRVIPMLPEPLSNGICSINPEVERLCMACEMDISATGTLSRYRFFPAVMRSAARLTYNEVWEALSDPKSDAANKLKALLPRLGMLYKLFKALAKARGKRGAIDFETIETQMVFDDQGKIERILPTLRNDAHRIIEECMLAANVCASDFLQSRHHPALYRVHEGPTPEKLVALREFLRGFGLSLSGGDEPHAKDYARLLDSIKQRPDVQLIQTVLLRSLKQAVYSPDNVGHFGLAYESYTHFTSPIRRYPDLLVHRAIKAVLQGRDYSPGKWSEIGMHCSMTERRADEASREVENWLKCYFMRDKVGEEYTGTISAVTSFGIFVSLDEVYVEGLVHVSDLGDEYFQFDGARHHMLGERTGKRYRLSDRVRVKVVRADLDTRRIDFVLAPDDGVNTSASGKTGRKKPGQKTRG